MVMVKSPCTRAGTSPARRALVNRTAFGVSAFGFDPWRERPLRGRVAVQRRRPRRADGLSVLTFPFRSRNLADKARKMGIAVWRFDKGKGGA